MKHLITSMLMIAVVLFAATPASAGGWAVTTLDPLPSATAGQSVVIGFTIRQHGVTPVNPEGDVGIVLRSSAGEERFFVAEPSGSVGHYETEVSLPETGSWTWGVRQGWFAEQPLGPLELATSSTARPASHRWPGGLRLALPGVAMLFGAAAISGLVSQRRRHEAAT